MGVGVEEDPQVGPDGEYDKSQIYSGVTATGHPSLRHGSIELSTESGDFYEKVRPLGRGSFGAVMLVKHTESKRLYAVKTLHFGDNKPSAVAAFQEVRLMQLFKHPCTIDLKEAYLNADGHSIHLVMPYCESGTLDRAIHSAKKQNKPLGETQVLKFLVQLCLSVHYIHELGILHRDLKPENCMLTESKAILKVGDFGLAKHITPAGGGGGSQVTEVGTPYYTSPEMVASEAYSFPSDVWSMGCIFYEMLQLRPPFLEEDKVRLVTMVVSQDPPAISPSYSLDVRLLCQWMLQKSPQRRPTVAQILSTSTMRRIAKWFVKAYNPMQAEGRERITLAKELKCQVAELENLELITTDYIQEILSEPDPLQQRNAAKLKEVEKANTGGSGIDSNGTNLSRSSPTIGDSASGTGGDAAAGGAAGAGVSSSGPPTQLPAMMRGFAGVGASVAAGADTGGSNFGGGGGNGANVKGGHFSPKMQSSASVSWVQQKAGAGGDHSELHNGTCNGTSPNGGSGGGARRTSFRWGEPHAAASASTSPSSSSTATPTASFSSPTTSFSRVNTLSTVISDEREGGSMSTVLDTDRANQDGGREGVGEGVSASSSSTQQEDRKAEKEEMLQQEREEKEVADADVDGDVEVTEYSMADSIATTTCRSGSCSISTSSNKAGSDTDCDNGSERACSPQTDDDLGGVSKEAEGATHGGSTTRQSNPAQREGIGIKGAEDQAVEGGKEVVEADGYPLAAGAGGNAVMAVRYHKKSAGQEGIEAVDGGQESPT